MCTELFYDFPTVLGIVCSLVTAYSYGQPVNIRYMDTSLPGFAVSKQCCWVELYIHCSYWFVVLCFADNADVRRTRFFINVDADKMKPSTTYITTNPLFSSLVDVSLGKNIFLCPKLTITCWRKSAETYCLQVHDDMTSPTLTFEIWRFLNRQNLHDHTGRLYNMYFNQSNRKPFTPPRHTLYKCSRTTVPGCIGQHHHQSCHPPSICTHKTLASQDRLEAHSIVASVQQICTFHPWGSAKWQYHFITFSEKDIWLLNFIQQ